MKTSDAFNSIFCMYRGKPFPDEQGRLVYVSDPFDCLINAFEIFERVLFLRPGDINGSLYQRFMEETINFLESIDIEEFREKARASEKSVKEIILRNLDKIAVSSPEIDLSQYTLALLTL